MDDSVLKMFGNWVVWLALLPLIGFVVVYSTRSPWRSTWIGIALLLQKVLLTLLVIVILIGLFWPEMPGREIIRLVVFLACVVTFWLDFIQALVIQHRARHPKRDDPTERRR